MNTITCKPLLPVMLLAIVLGVAGFLCAIFLTVFASEGASVEEVTFAYDEKQILKDFNAVFTKEKITGIHGPSGCGKSTLSGADKIFEFN